MICAGYHEGGHDACQVILYAQGPRKLSVEKAKKGIRAVSRILDLEVWRPIRNDVIPLQINFLTDVGNKNILKSENVLVKCS